MEDVIELTSFKSLFDTSVSNSFKFKNWNQFKSALYYLSTREGYKPKRGEFKKGSPLISPAIFKDNTSRRNENVLRWGGWAALDIDDYDGSFESAIKVFEGYRYICYSTASSTREHPKFRVVFDTNGIIPADKIKHFWYALNKQFNTMGDPQTKDLSRMYFVPAKYPRAFNFIFDREGERLDPYAMMRRWEYVEPAGNTLLSKLPPEIQKAVLKHQREKLNNRNFSWSSYHDCPFVNKKMVQEYKTISETGWYSKLFAIMINIASNAVKARYPISAAEISSLCRQIDLETGNWYKKRPLEKEASRALDYVLANSI